MITKDEIIGIYEDREKRLEKWLEGKPEEKTILQLKKDLKSWQNEITDAQKLAHDNDPLFAPNDLGSSYTFMNIFSAIFSNYVIALCYIKKLEKELKSKTRKPKN